MTIADKLQLTLNTKQAIKSALITKGAEPTDVFSTYPALIESLATQGIATPQIIAPMDGAVQVSQQPIITGTLYFSADPDDGHAASTWEFASDSGFTNILHTSGRDTVNLESYDFLANGAEFTESEPVYARVTYESESGIEQTSPVISFDVFVINPGDVIDGDIIVGRHQGDWILVAPATKRALRKWGLYRINLPLPLNPVPDPNTGAYNTDVLTSPAYNSVSDGIGSVGSPAADYCRDMGYDLPNREVLDMIYQNRAIIDSSETTTGGKKLADIVNGGTAASNGYGYVWSSTLGHVTNNAMAHKFTDGNLLSSFRGDPLWVVPVKRISI
ncbi:hypothetical protein ACIGG6_02065 [Vreelandella lionensis]|uniref:Uncharacterized protein n=1 Tax=Vreelandella lionensis TaxID=1144478 RepID=A0ABW8BNI2_9GAMM